MDQSRWTDPAWLADAETWIADRLAELELTPAGPIEQPHVERWSTVLRVPTGVGPVWFKANDGSLRHEAGIVSLLADRAPERVPPLLAADPERGWMLMADAGRRLREVLAEDRSLDRWFDVLGVVARIQLSCQDLVPQLLDLGVPDRRLATLPDAYDRLVAGLDVEPRFRVAAPYVAELCDRLAACGIAETLQHDDLHDGQVFVRDGRNLVMDWGDACVSHPFFALSVTLEGVIACGLDDVENSVDTGPFRDAFLAPYAVAYPDLAPMELLTATNIATRLGWVCRAVNGHVPGDDGPTRTRLGMFLNDQAGAKSADEFPRRGRSYQA